MGGTNIYHRSVLSGQSYKFCQNFGLLIACCYCAKWSFVGSTSEF